jgi:hypothetical protein
MNELEERREIARLDAQLDLYRTGRLQPAKREQDDRVEAFGDAFQLQAGLPVESPHPLAHRTAFGSRRMPLTELAAIRAGLDYERDPVLQVRAALTGSDFGTDLAAAMTRVLGVDYSRQSEEHLQVVMDLPVKGMRPAALPVIDLGELQKIPGAGGPVPASALDVRVGQTVKPYVWAARFIISRELLISDEIGLLGQIARQLAGHCSRLEAKRIGELLNANGNLSDGAPLIGPSNTSIATGISASALSEALGLLRTRTTPAGSVANLRGRFLLVPPALEGLALVAARELMNGPEARLTVVVNSWLSGKSSYLLTDPLDAPVFIRSFPEGFEPIPSIERIARIVIPETNEPVHYDGQAFSASTIVGVDAVGRLGVVKLPGAD